MKKCSPPPPPPQINELPPPQTAQLMLFLFSQTVVLSIDITSRTCLLLLLNEDGAHWYVGNIVEAQLSTCSHQKSGKF